MAKSSMRDIQSLRNEVDMLSEKLKMTQEMLYMLRQNVDSLKTIITMQERPATIAPKSKSMRGGMIETEDDNVEPQFQEPALVPETPFQHTPFQKTTVQKRRCSLI
jgi:hypothetical protein